MGSPQAWLDDLNPTFAGFDAVGGRPFLEIGPLSIYVSGKLPFSIVAIAADNLPVSRKGLKFGNQFGYGHGRTIAQIQRRALRLRYASSPFTGWRGFLRI